MNDLYRLGTAILAGLLGGICGPLVVRSVEGPPAANIVRARSFELVDEAGRAISYWGIDESGGAVLAFGRYASEPSPTLRSGHARRSLGNIENQRVMLGVSGDNASLELRGADGKPRVRLLLDSYGKPVLLMEDETGPRVSLGIEHSDTPGPQDKIWALDFGPDGRARIGMFTEKDRGQTYVRGLFSVNRDRIKYPYQQTK